MPRNRAAILEARRRAESAARKALAEAIAPLKGASTGSPEAIVYEALSKANDATLTAFTAIQARFQSSDLLMPVMTPLKDAGPESSNPVVNAIKNAHDEMMAAEGYAISLDDMTLVGLLVHAVRFRDSAAKLEKAEKPKKPTLDVIKEDAEKPAQNIIKDAIDGLRPIESRSRLLRQAVKVDPTMRRTDHHEDAQTFYG